MVIKIKKIDKDMPDLLQFGNWIDIYASKVNGQDFVEDVPFVFQPGDFAMINSGFATELQPGYEAYIAPRSSSCKKYGFIMTNSIGIIDTDYNGDNDEWKVPVYFLKSGIIKKYDRIAQFRIQRSMDNIECVYVNKLNNTDRGGFGSSNVDHE